MEEGGREGGPIGVIVPFHLCFATVNYFSFTQEERAKTSKGEYMNESM